MLIPPKPLTPAQIKLQAMLAKARANLAASSVAQVQAVQAMVVANDVHDIDLSNVVPAKATEAEKEEALDAVISAQSVELSSSAVASAGSAATERHTGSSTVSSSNSSSSTLATAVASILQTAPKIGVMRDIELNAAQRKAVDIIVAGADLVLIGKAGTGKTTMMRTAMEELIASNRIPMLQGSTKVLQSGLPGVAVVSYTNKAVNNIRHAMPGSIKPHTVTLHKLLEFEPKY